MGLHSKEFSLQELLEATDNFSEEHKIGSRQLWLSLLTPHWMMVAVKWPSSVRNHQPQASSSVGGHTRRQEDKDDAFVNELESLSRLPTRIWFDVWGFTKDAKERILVYEVLEQWYLHDHLHKNPVAPLLSWSARIQVALDAARGIEYLHVYAVPTNHTPRHKVVQYIVGQQVEGQSIRFWPIFDGSGGR
ncbi:hypothetical protein M0R45_026752 [Rubus argutus]|uniref:Serine-threonine/tyrosine-protein kinase catalytic domain-containing protein n=1 Tax=Rubus argutus TaxID=59490 RepID=A0AAW1WYB3_RUBAR